MLLLLQLLQQRQQGPLIGRAVLVPSVRIVETADAMHFFDGRRLVSLTVDPAARAAMHVALGHPHRAGTTRPAIGTGKRGAVGGAPEASDASEAGDARALLASLGLLTSDDGGSWRDEIGAQYATTAALPGLDGPAAARRLRDTTVHVLSGDADELLRCLRSSGLRCVGLASGDDVASAVAALDPARSLVVATAFDSRPVDLLQAVNAACLDAGVPWLPIAAFDGAALHVGPLVLPGDTACFACLRRRLAANTSYADLFDDVVGQAPAAPTPRALRTLAYSFATLLLLNWIAGNDPDVPGLLLTLDPARLAVRQSRVFRVPRCPACSGPDYTTAAAPWESARDH